MFLTLTVLLFWPELNPASPLAAQTSIRLDDVTDRTGIDFVHVDGHTGKYYLVEAMSAGLALLDYDLDGDDDIYFVNGAPLGNNTGRLIDRPRNALYRNDGNFQFTDVTQAAGVGDTGFGLGVACADYDNDGAVDIYVNNFGGNVLYHNNLDGTFCPVSEFAGVVGGNRVGAGCSFLDIDADGDLDLYVANYVQFDLATHRTHVFKGLPAYPSPLSLNAEADILFLNRGDGTFEDISTASGIDRVAGRSMGLATFDFDRDGDIDVMVANDAQENFLFENDGAGHFEEIGVLAGVAYDYLAKPQASMGVELVDLDSDQRLDLFVTSYSEEFAAFYRMDSFGLFEDKSLRTGAAEATYSHVTWGVVAADFDNNGSQDLFVATGDIDDLRDRRAGMSRSSAYRLPNIVLKNDGRGKLTDLKDSWGSGAAARESSRGVVAGDLNLDGQIDVVVQNSRRRPQLLRNASDSVGYIQLELVGRQCNRDAAGTIVAVEQAGRKQITQTRSGHSYQSENSKCVHFGLADASAPVQIKVHWPGTSRPTLTNAAPNQKLRLIQRP